LILRRSFDPLCGLVQNELGKRVVEGDAFIFINKRHTHQKLLIREKNGFTIFTAGWRRERLKSCI
jgi:hypothetical protein